MVATRSSEQPLGADSPKVNEALVLHMHELDSVNNCTELGRGPQASGEIAAWADNLVSALWDSEAENLTAVFLSYPLLG